MKIHSLLATALAVFCFTTSCSAPRDEAQERDAIDEAQERDAIKVNVYALFFKKEFEKLENLSTEYRTLQSRTSSGIWHLGLYYNGISLIFKKEYKEEGIWQDLEQRAAGWIARYPQSASAHLAYATMLLNRAWGLRGNDYARNVEPENWAPFRQYAEEARVYLEKHKGVASIDPYWYELMTSVALAQGWSEQEYAKLMSEAFAREPLYYENYFSAILYYLPVWYGDIMSIEKFARYALEKTKDQEGSGIYARIYWYAADNHFGNKLFSESLVDWGTMKKGIDDVLKRYPNRWNVNHFASFACMARDKEKTAELIGRMEGGPLKFAWRARETGKAWRSIEIFERCKAWAFS